MRWRAGRAWDGLNYSRGFEISSKIYYTGNLAKAGEARGVDPITLLIEAVGVAILLLWIVIPIREFHGILKRVRRRDTAAVYGPPNASSTREPHA